MNRKISRRILQDRLIYVEQMIEKITALPLEDRTAFFSDERNIWTVESCLRRALEALLDAGRHILAKGFGVGVTEYKQVAHELGRLGVLSVEEQHLLRILAGYRNRMVHFYFEIGQDELYEIARTHLDDLRRVASALSNWAHSHPENVIEDL
ncbi:MAG: hypothetical protein ANABAC_1721 [Anaerolineae bacterium]|jgi:uncharacterized protein YutE (UPF0331/DUF86 family)|nr:MAG: hypothetical protein ANABAC_1721 [Anaerolineae bacterium]